ncbi:PKD domain-containing protein [Candidatus Leptofilum sp.]|uniref:PKD domain-containing protein n=1 Tax=Candidatus Leptofilum sp. TaxID=3241576 RepID=UPI003B58CF74
MFSVAKARFVLFPILIGSFIVTFLLLNLQSMQTLHAAPGDIVVNSVADVVADDGQCTLREAITAANLDTASGSNPGECIAGSGDDLIDLTGLNGVILLTDRLPDIASNMIVQGPDATLLTLDGGGNGRIFTIVAGTVTVADLAITNGYEGVSDGRGGGIFNSSPDEVRIENSIIRDNAVLGDNPETFCSSTGSLFFGGGGGIFHTGNGTLYIVNTTITDNSATGGHGGSHGYGTGGGGGGGAFGGGLFNDGGTVHLVNSDFTDNSVTGGRGCRGGPRGNGGSSGCSGAWGGGERNGLGGGGQGGDYGHVNGRDGNFGGGGGGGQNPNGVGGVSAFGGGTGGNGGFGLGGAGGGGAALGGGVFNYSGTVQITNSRFEGNTVVGGEGPDNAEFGQGIANAVFNLDTLQVENSTFPNTAPTLDNLNPPANATNVSIDQMLTWDVEDIDGDSILYGYDPSGLTVTVAFGNDPLNLIAATNVFTSYVPPEQPLQPDATYYWELTATDGISTTSSGVISFTTAPLPTVDFTAVTPQGARPFTANFTNNTVDADSYLWDFGDGSSSTAVHPNHEYAASGSYTVTLQATGPGGTDSLTKPDYILVYDLPEPDFAATPLAGLPNLSVEFTNLSQFADSYVWDYGDGTTSTTADATHSHTYTAPGSYTVVLTATNSYGSESTTKTAYVTVYETAVADFTASPLEGVAPLFVDFTNLSQNSDSYLWEYGNGGTSPTFEPTHLYFVPGVYTVTLTASNPVSSDTVTKVAYITVHPQAVANFTATPQTGTAPLEVTFTNLSSEADSYVWEYGDGTTSTTTSATHTHLYTEPGQYDVTLTAMNAHSSHTFTQAAYVTVYAEPVASFLASPTSGTGPLLVNFTNYSLNATETLWDFGDGSTSTALNPSHLYLQAGVYTVTLTASNAGGSDVLSRPAYIVVNTAPQADFSADVQAGITPLTVTFTNISTEADSYVWDYGDGTTSTTTAVTHTHIYTTPGTYSVSLTATNAYGSDVQLRSGYITVYELPVPAFTATPTEGAAPLTVAFTNESVNGQSYVWDFGDGSSSTAVSPTHIYTQPGIYTVSLQASNPGGSQSITHNNLIVVQNPPVPAFTAEPTAGLANLTVTFTNLSTFADSYFWDYGDGTTSSNDAASHIHQYDAPGTYTVRLTAINSYASSSLMETDLITVYDIPVADFEATVDFGASPLEVGFANLSSGATSYLWDFGDGNSSTAATPTHLYTQGGSYTVTLTASNPFASDTAVKTSYITVYDEPIASFTALPRIGAAPLLVTFQQESQFANSYTWEYGDGISSTETAVAHTHLYTEPGTYTVTLTASNAYGTDQAIQIGYITVVEPPTATAYFVDSEGGSNSGDGSQTNPWQTITYALSQVTGPDVQIYVASGTYDEALGEAFPLIMEPGVNVLGANRESTIVSGIDTEAVFRFPNTSIYTETTVLRGFKISNGVHGVRVDGSMANYPSPTIDGNWLTENEQGIFVQGVSSQRAYPIITNNWLENNALYGINIVAGYNGTTFNPIISHNRIAYNGQAGIRCYAQGSGSSGGLSRCSPEISYNEIIYNAGDGILCQTYYAGRCNSTISHNFIAYNSDWGFDRSHSGTYIQISVDATTRPTLLNNLIVHNGSGGAQFITNTSERFDQPTLINNTIADNGAYGVRNGRPTIYNSIIWGHNDDLNVSVSYVNYSTIGDGEYGGLNSNVSANPQFIAAASDDYRLSYLSPAIDAGDNSVAGLPESDLEGNARIINGTVDMGANEFAVGPLVEVAVVAWPDPVTPGEPLQYTMWVTNTGSLPLNATVQAILPPQATYSGPTSWTADLDAPADVWQRSFTVNVVDSFTGQLTTEIQVSSTQGAVATAVATTTAAWPATSPVLAVSPSSLSLSALVGDPAFTRSLDIMNTGTGSLSWTTVANASWLTLSANSGTAPATVQLTIDPATLAPGTYTGLITVSSANAVNGSQLIPVTLTIAAPETIQLDAEGGYATIMLKWNVANLPNLANYRLLLGDNGVDSSTWTPIATVNRTTYFYEDDTLTPGETVCFQVEGLKADGSTLAVSNMACAVYGETTLWIPEVSAMPGGTVIVPVNIRNAEGLQMAAADIWVEFDATVLEPLGVTATPLTDGYIWSYAIAAVDGKPDFARAQIGALSTNPPTLFGDGSLFWLEFRVLGNPGDTSMLDLRDFISGLGGSTIYAPDDLSNPIPLNLEDGSLVVDGSFVLGDLNGNGVVETVDAYIALRIAVNRLTATADQLRAGDVNGNGRIDVGDATMIFYRAVHGQWPSLPAARTQQNSGSVTLRLDDIAGKPGESVTTALRAEGLSDWAGGRFTIVYDTAVIANIESVTVMDAAADFTLEYYDDGTGVLVIGLIGDVPSAIDSALVEITLQLTEDVETTNVPLLLADAEFNDLVGRDFATSSLQISIERVSGAVTVNTTSEIYLPLVIKP